MQILSLTLLSLLFFPLLSSAQEAPETIPEYIFVEQEPPAEAPEEITPPPSSQHIWIRGHWKWQKGWVWINGQWVKRPHPDAVWIPGNYLKKHQHWVWVPGHWE